MSFQLPQPLRFLRRRKNDSEISTDNRQLWTISYQLCRRFGSPFHTVRFCNLVEVLIDRKIWRRRGTQTLRNLKRMWARTADRATRRHTRALTQLSLLTNASWTNSFPNFAPNSWCIYNGMNSELWLLSRDQGRRQKRANCQYRQRRRAREPGETLWW